MVPVIFPLGWPPEAVAPGRGPGKPLVFSSGPPCYPTRPLREFRFWARIARSDIRWDGMAYTEGFSAAWRLFGRGTSKGGAR